MKKLFIFLLLLATLTACAPKKSGDQRVAMVVGDIPVTVAEYKAAFAASPYGAQNTSESRRQFLESYAIKLMILEEAQNTGLDRDSEFLKDVESFWQQALVKRMLEKKMAQYSGLITVSEQQVQAYFIQNQNGYFRGKNFDDVFQSIKTFLIFQQQNQAMDNWVQSLKGKIKLRANRLLVGI